MSMAATAVVLHIPRSCQEVVVSGKRRSDLVNKKLLKAEPAQRKFCSIPSIAAGDAVDRSLTLLDYPTSTP